MDKLVDSLIKKGILKTPKVIKAFRRIDRKDFVLEKLSSFAYADEALPIGGGQTISQPYTVAFMLELLRPQVGNQILDIGSGSMWQSALLAEIVGAGRVYAIEINPVVFGIGQGNISKYPKLQKNINAFCQNANIGLPEIAQNISGFDRIIAAAEVEAVSEAWRQQLKINGRLVYPKSRSIFLEIKKSENEFELSEFPGFVFVPFKN